MARTQWLANQDLHSSTTSSSVTPGRSVSSSFSSRRDWVGDCSSVLNKYQTLTAYIGGVALKWGGGGGGLRDMVKLGRRVDSRWKKRRNLVGQSKTTIEMFAGTGMPEI